MNLNRLTRLSQSHLNLFEECPRKFQHTYLNQLKSIPQPQYQENVLWGNQFHLLMQQRALGLPIEALLAENKEMGRSFYALLQANPEILTPGEAGWRDAEHCRTLPFQNYLLTVIYDLLITQSHQAQILDWKTYLQPQKLEKLAKNWQTRLYLYVLAETSEYPPEAISMTYWFVKPVESLNSLVFRYNSAQHQQTQADLADLLENLNQYLINYQKHKIAFPALGIQKKRCQRCSFESRCQEEISSNQDLNWQKALNEIEEVPL